ncbi:hypothetical protein BKA56DRAFT_246097 [Ilyonectria sp. MPI-CAGE-AT-0026]|nr:hypothetical protein BKA56DRAFT_246097 [Ilyonectria sp. MPI-CAGE-AT-0026]
MKLSTSTAMSAKPRAGTIDVTLVQDLSSSDTPEHGPTRNSSSDSVPAIESEPIRRDHSVAPHTSDELSQAERGETPTANSSGGTVRRVRRYLSWWKSPILMLTYYLVGLSLSFVHCAVYVNLNGTKVGGSDSQENNIRIGTALASLSQFALAASVWEAYGIWFWRAVETSQFRIYVLSAIFSADTSILPFFKNKKILSEVGRKFKVGLLMALFAWSLMLPAYFTPSSISVYESTEETTVPGALVPVPSISNTTKGDNYTYSPSHKGDKPGIKWLPARIFSGARTELSLLSAATASTGEILPIKAPFNHSLYSIDYFGPAVNCRMAVPSEQLEIDNQLRIHMDRPVGSSRQLKSAYYAFVPGFDVNGKVSAISEVRIQAPMNITSASNQIWMVFSKYVDDRLDEPTCDYKPHYQVCELWNATYQVGLSWDSSFPSQQVNGSYELLHKVNFPDDKPDSVSDMTQHAYSAFFWAFANQIVGSLGWFADNSTGFNHGVIDTPIQQNILLGSNDLDVFFNFNENPQACRVPWANLSLQRRRDKNLARNRTLNVLIHELSFNTTVSLLHNELYTDNTTAIITMWENVNRYGCNLLGLILPYGLANLFALITVTLGAASCPYKEIKECRLYLDRDLEAMFHAAKPKVVQDIQAGSQGCVTAHLHATGDRSLLVFDFVEECDTEKEASLFDIDLRLIFTRWWQWTPRARGGDMPESVTEDISNRRNTNTSPC